MRGEIDVRVVDLGRAVLEKLDDAARRELRQQIVEGPAEDLGRRVAEYALAGRD